MSVTSLQHAQIQRVDPPGEPIRCMFNPKEYSFAKQNTWTEGRARGANVPHLDFGGGRPATLQMQLFFDTYAAAEEPAMARDVRKEYTDAIWELMLVDKALTDTKTRKSRPPVVHFQWGLAWSFDAVITSITQRFTLFTPAGVPVRATLDVTFQQVKDQKLYPSQNPTSGGMGGGRLWTVREGDTLAGIAFAEYGDPTRWRPIAAVNGLTRVRHLPSGSVLEIPDA